MSEVKTIKLQGKNYAQVNDRLKAFHSMYKNGAIQTEPNFDGDIVKMKAIIIPDVTNPLRQYTAHSYGSLKGVKAFEKLETVAVGRALAYLGFSIDGSIASAEEMENFNDKQEHDEEKPELTKDKLDSMLDYIKQGKGEDVKKAMAKYTINEEFLNELNFAFAKQDQKNNDDLDHNIEKWVERMEKTK